LEARLGTDHYLDINTSNQLASAFQALREEVPYVSALEIRDAEGGLLLTSATPTRTENRLLSPGYAALFESAVKSGRPGYSSLYTEPMRGHGGHFFDLFIVSRWGQKQGLVAKLSAVDLLRMSREELDKEEVSGLDLEIVEATTWAPEGANKTLWPAARWAFERNGLRLTLSGKASAPLANTTLALQWLFACLGGLAALSVSLWIRGLRYRKLTKSRLEEIEKKMQSDARIATLGEMSTAIAHELNQPLGAISNYAYAAEKIAKQQPNPEPALLEGLTQIRREAERGAEVIKSIRNFIRREELASEQIDVAALLNDLRPILELQAQSQGSNLSIEVKDSLVVNCSKALLQQVILNLTKNGLDAMRDLPKTSRFLQIKAGLNETTQRVMFEVIDSGHGISEEVKKSLFKPFFTTKKDGLGIGLNLCLSIAERQGGTVMWQNNLTGGARFVLELPAKNYR
jgi:signal transduction histidine kinase